MLKFEFVFFVLDIFVVFGYSSYKSSNYMQVSPGSDCIFAQDVAAVNTTEKHCCVIGELGKRVVVTPDISSVLNSVIDLG